MASPISVFDSILGAIQKAADYNRRQIRCQQADKVSGTDCGQIGGRKPFSFPDTFSVHKQPRAWRIADLLFLEIPDTPIKA